MISLREVWRGGARKRRIFPVGRELDLAELTEVEAAPIDYATGCVLLIHRRVFEEIGLLDERFFMDDEDIKFSQRARNAGVQLRVATRAIAWHMVGASLRHRRPERVFLQFQSRTIWCRTTRGWHAVSLWTVVLLATARLTLGCLVKRDWKVFTAMWRGLYSGLRSADCQVPRLAYLPNAMPTEQTDDPTSRAHP